MSTLYMAGLRVFGRAFTTTPVFGPSGLPRLSFSLIRPDTLATSSAHCRHTPTGAAEACVAPSLSISEGGALGKEFTRHLPDIRRGVLTIGKRKMARGGLPRAIISRRRRAGRSPAVRYAA